jgi:hypothetical protein
MAGKEQYQATIGNLLHLAHCTRPDIALPIRALGGLLCSDECCTLESGTGCGGLPGRHSRDGDPFWRLGCPTGVVV